MPIRFPEIPFGPFELRPLLRRTLGPDERLVGWAVARDQASAGTNLIDAACMLVPGVGHAIIAVRRGTRGVKARLLVLTDRRLLVLAATRSIVSEIAALEADVQLAELHVHCAGANDSLNALWRWLRRRPDPAPGQEYPTRFSLRSRAGWSVDLDIPQTYREPTERLREALVVLAIDSLCPPGSPGAFEIKPT